MSKKYLNVIPYFGGKTVHLAFLFGHLPENIRHMHFVDVFTGSASVGVNVKRTYNPALLTINDIYDEVVNLFRCLREDPDRLILSIKNTPFSRVEFDLAKEFSSDPFEKARRYFVRSVQSWGGVGSQKLYATWGGQFKVCDEKESNFRVDTWNSRLELLPEIASVLRSIQVENLHYCDVLRKYDNQNTFFYIDPPYDKATRNQKNRYAYEFEDKDHKNLSDLLHSIKGKCMISGFDGELYRELYKDFRFTKGKEKRYSAVKVPASECLWFNY